jgi:hypothetical protein
VYGCWQEFGKQVEGVLPTKTWTLDNYLIVRSEWLREGGRTGKQEMDISAAGLWGLSNPGYFFAKRFIEDW